MRTKKTFRIGILIILSDPYWVQAMEAIVHTSALLGDELVILQPATTNRGMREVSHRDLIDQILASSLDAIVTTIPFEKILVEFLEANLPVVCLGEVELRHPKLTVTRSLYPGGYMAGEFIAKALDGKGHAVCVSAGRDQMPVVGQSRLAGFEDSLRAFPGITTGVIHSYWDYASAFPSLVENFRTYPQKIDAIFGVSDTLALAAWDAGVETGVIDRHTLLVGLNGDPLALAAIADGHMAATIDTASEMLGAIAFRTAHQGADGEKMPEELPQDFRLITQANVAEIATQKLIAIADIPSHMVGYNRQVEQERISQLEKSMEITRRLATLRDRDRLVEDIGELVCRHYGYEWIRIFRRDEDTQSLSFFGGIPSPASEKVPVDQDELIKEVLQSKRSIFIPDLRSSRRMRYNSEWEGVRSRAVFPITAGDDVIGVLDLQSSNPFVHPTLETVGLELLSTQLGIALQNADLFQNALEARLSAEKANQLKTRLMANVGHEMRTPLNAILGFSQAIEKDLESGQFPTVEGLRHDIDNIYRSGEHLMCMINDLLDLSRAEIGALNLYFEPVELLPILKDVFQTFQCPANDDSQVLWKFDAPERLPLVRADVVRFRQIMINLLSNAKKFTRQGQICVGAKVEPPFVHIWVSDTGPGVSMELQAKIFEPFGTMAQKSRREGIGLGLSITRHLVTLHNGLITMESAPGVGSTFHVYLPLPGLTNEPLAITNEITHQAILVLCERDWIPDEIQAIGEDKNIPLIQIDRRTDLKKIISDYQPIAIAWDYNCADPENWLVVSRIIALPKLASVPVIFYNSHPPTGSAQQGGLTHLIFTPNCGNAFGEWLEQIKPEISQDSSILIVDDDQGARSHYHALIKEKSPRSTVYEVSDGKQAIAFLAHHAPPGLILLDLAMPEMDGFTVLQKIRSDKHTRNIPVIVVSGKSLDFQDIQRLDSTKTIIAPKGELSDDELHSLIRGVLDDRAQLAQPTSRLVKNGLAFIHQYFDQGIGRKEIAYELGISPNYLTDIFREEMGITPVDYLNRVRLRKAREILEETNLPITVIAFKVGFSDPAYFSRVFHRTWGVTPMEYRRSCTKNK